MTDVPVGSARSKKARKLWGGSSHMPAQSAKKIRPARNAGNRLEIQTTLTSSGPTTDIRTTGEKTEKFKRRRMCSRKTNGRTSVRPLATSKSRDAEVHLPFDFDFLLFFFVPITLFLFELPPQDVMTISRRERAVPKDKGTSTMAGPF